MDVEPYLKQVVGQVSRSFPDAEWDDLMQEARLWVLDTRNSRYVAEWTSGPRVDQRLGASVRRHLVEYVGEDSDSGSAWGRAQFVCGFPLERLLLAWARGTESDGVRFEQGVHRVMTVLEEMSQGDQDFLQGFFEELPADGRPLWSKSGQQRYKRVMGRLEGRLLDGPSGEHEGPGSRRVMSNSDAQNKTRRDW